MPKAVFAGCARSCAQFLDAVLANVAALGATYDAFDLVVVENDSNDDTRRRLRDHATAHANVRLIEADGLAAAHPKRTDRLAAARNMFMRVVREPRYADYDDLIVLDFDDVHCRRVDPDAFTAARNWLWQEDDRRAVFANSAPFYYDVWTLRHPTWSPDDCFVRVRAEPPTLPRLEAVRRHVAARQVPIAPTAAPILVDSAFGGLAIYRRAATLGATYVGLYPDGEEVCEHVAFNAAVKGADGIFAIYPALLVHAPAEHVMGALGRPRIYKLEQDGARCMLIGPPDHPLAGFRAEHPLYDRRFPVLARLVSARAPNAHLIDVGANIGDSIALARLAGATMPAIAIEASLTYSKYLWENVQRAPAVFGEVRPVWGFVGAAGAAGGVSIGAGTGSAAAAGEGAPVERAPGVTFAALAGKLEVSLVKTDTDGFDQEIVAAELEFLRDKAPILWLEAQTMAIAAEDKWRALLGEMAGQWPRMMLFDNFGFAIAAGDTAELAGLAVELMAYSRRQRERPDFRPTLYYLDIALFPERFAPVYDAFCAALPELGA